MTPRKLNIGLYIAITAVLVILSILGMKTWLSNWRDETLAKWRSIKIGDTVTGLLQRLGEPEIQYSKNSAPTDYYVGGYAKKRRVLTGSVYIYFERDLILYVWLSPSGTVEEVYWGSS